MYCGVAGMTSVKLEGAVERCLKCLWDRASLAPSFSSAGVMPSRGGGPAMPRVVVRNATDASLEEALVMLRESIITVESHECYLRRLVGIDNVFKSY